jgi:ATP-dependent helicase/DNAse subunit B
VSVLDPLSLRARRVRALFVCGMQEGRFPAPATERSLLGSEERRRLAETGGLRLAEERDALAAERYLMYAVASRPEELLVLSWHAAGEDGVAQTRSLFVDDVCDLFAEDLLAARDRRTAAAQDTRATVRRGPGAAEETLRTHTDGIAPLNDPELLEELRARTWSASSLEAWLRCPVRWFVERVLRAGELEPEAEPLGRGGLAHAALKQTFEELRVQTGSARVTTETLELARALLARALEENEAHFSISSAPERRPALRRRLRADLERYLGHAAQANERGLAAHLEPAHLELEFGLGEGAEGSPPLPALDLGEGVRVRGRIDRIDVGARGEAVVYDYKGARVSAPDKWLADGSVQVALYMHAAERLLDLRPLGGFYQPLAGSDLRARGVLARGEGVELACVGGDEREPAEIAELVGDVLALARGAAHEAAEGRLQARPRTCSPKGGCTYPTICRCESH